MSASWRMLVGVTRTPCQFFDARSNTDHSSDRQLGSPGSRPMTFRRRLVSPKVRSI